MAKERKLERKPKEAASTHSVTLVLHSQVWQCEGSRAPGGSSARPPAARPRKSIQPGFSTASSTTRPTTHGQAPGGSGSSSAKPSAARRPCKSTKPPGSSTMRPTTQSRAPSLRSQAWQREAGRAPAGRTGPSNRPIVINIGTTNNFGDAKEGNSSGKRLPGAHYGGHGKCFRCGKVDCRHMHCVSCAFVENLPR